MWAGSAAWPSALSGSVFAGERWVHGSGGTSAMLLSVLIPRDPAPIQLASGDSEELLEGKWLVLSKETETELCCSLQDPKMSWLILLLPSTEWWKLMRWTWAGGPKCSSVVEKFQLKVDVQTIREVKLQRTCRQTQVLIFVDQHLHLAHLSISVLIPVVSSQRAQGFPTCLVSHAFCLSKAKSDSKNK